MCRARGIRFMFAFLRDLARKRFLYYMYNKKIYNYFFIHSESRVRTSTGRKNCLLYIYMPWS